MSYPKYGMFHGKIIKLQSQTSYSFGFQKFLQLCKLYIASGPVRFYCFFLVNRNRNRLPSSEIQKKPDQNCQKPPKTGLNQFEPVFWVFHYNRFELTKTENFSGWNYST